LQDDTTLYRETIDNINKYGISVKKKYGQNFLKDTRVLDKIIAGAQIDSDDTVLEVGPGLGNLTKELAKIAGRVVAVEIDINLIEPLKEILRDYPNVSILQGDILDLLEKGLEPIVADKPYKVVANLPYYITTPIIMGFLESSNPPQSLTVMLQKEVAQRMKAAPCTKDYSALTLAVEYYADTYLVANVPRNCFIPRPNVDSAVLRLTRLKESPVRPINEEFLFKVIKASFAQRRKTLINALLNAKIGLESKETVSEALKAMGLADNIRGETLSLTQFSELSDILFKSTIN
jgi:16S rRNA (adenine1518-N6/adenine1519-N6)-dimethyltransferase